MFKKLTKISMIGLLSLGLFLSSTAFAAQRMFEVTITNITKDIRFTPILVASTHHGFALFKLGQPASDNVAKVAEGGDTSDLKAFLLLNGVHALDVQSSTGLLEPGKSVTVRIKRNVRYSHVSIISMLLPTNDAFFSINVGDIKRHSGSVFWARAYDAGTEDNDENCANIPGPKCGGDGYNSIEGEGFVYVHQGIKGVGDLNAADYDWKNPVAKITIRKIN